uniref:Class I helical cytokine receptor number 29 n=1 Tax=Tetraodon nigroviridis TaxID=99883 RepID=Q6UAM7_TETNG|nr:class I helical cytokine receptor number 29 [Tetraodon nigroviridis]
MLSSSVTSSSNCYSIWLLCLFLCCSATHTHAGDALLRPEQLSFSQNSDLQQIVISWVQGTTATFDILVLRTEFNETVFFETISVPPNPINGQHQWTWTSAEPLMCTSLSIKVRSRDGQRTSEWSSVLVEGGDMPSNPNPQMFPQDKIIHVGATITFCCIVEEGLSFGQIKYNNTVVNTTRLSRRTYSAVVVNREPTKYLGTNVICYPNNPSDQLTGSTMFAGYPPLLSNFECETRDLTSAVCSWNEARETHLYGRTRKTSYLINNRSCSDNTEKKCTLDRWENNWTLEAKNPLGQHNLTDLAELSHRVRPVAPANLTAVVHPRNATILWAWKYSSYSFFALVCEVVFVSRENKKHTFSGVGLQSVVLSDMVPNEKYTLKIRCGAQRNFWKWGDWSEQFSFTTSTTVPDAPDVWVWMNRDNTGQVIWKTLEPRQSHGRLTGYKVTFQSAEENLQHPINVSPDISTAPFNLTHMATLSTDKIEATVVAVNDDGASLPSRVLIPLRWTEKEPIAVSRAVYTNGGFPISWERDDNNGTCEYVVEWYNASCRKDCSVDWIKVATLNNFSVRSDNFYPGVRYNFSLYCCSSEPPQLLQRLQGYMQELVPSSPVPLSARQQDSNILLTWEEIPLANRRGFLLGYNVYVNNDSSLTLIADWLILEILTSLGITSLFLVCVTFICYKKRKCMVHIVEKPHWDSSKEMLVVIPEEDEEEDRQRMGDEPADTDEPTSLRYYNQVADERPIRPRFPDSSASSASSMESGRTDVTYTGIQTSGSLSAWSPSPHGSSDVCQSQADLEFGSQIGGGGGYQPQMQPRALTEEPFEPQAVSSGGYKPQSSWHFDSPTEAGPSGGLAPSLGSPTSVASTQFLLPDGDEHAEEKHQQSSAASWFTNLLSTTKP